MNKILVRFAYRSMDQWDWGTKAQRNKGTKAQRHKGTKAQRHKGTKALHRDLLTATISC